MATMVDCRDCGEAFERPVQRGRPAVKCTPCKEKIGTKVPSSEFAVATTNNVTLVDCKDCGVPFERPVQRGRPAVKCTACKSKNNTVMQFSKNNGATGTIETVELKIEEIDGIIWIENSEPCTECNKSFMRPRKRGRPPTKCVDCLAWSDAEKAATNTTSEEALEALYSGDKALLEGTPDEIPKGAEAQCPSPRGCGRLFTSDSACESHKSYTPGGNLASCKDPATLGMEPRERRGLPIWTRPSPKEVG